jgi:hypothetical protein
VEDLLGKAQAPLPNFEVERRDAIDVVIAAARQQAEQDRQAAPRAFESGRPQAYYMRHETEALHRLLEYPTGELADALVEMARRCVHLEDELQRMAKTPSEDTATRSASA